MSRDTLLAALRADAHLWSDFDAICGFGGRLAGTPGCDAAFAFVADRLAALGPVRDAPTRYHGWTLDAVRITIPDGAEIPALPLVGSVPTPGDVLLEVLDLGRGTPDQIAAAGDAVRGRAVLLEHQYAFADDTIHRRVKLGAAVVMAQPILGIGPVSGFPKLAEAVSRAAAPIAVRDVLMVNSDHANFAAHGVPALRLIAGFNEPACNVSRLLTAADTRALVSPPELLRGTQRAGAVLWHLLSLPAEQVAALAALPG